MLAVVQSMYQRLFAEVSAKLPGNELAWLKAAREKAITRFEKQGFPAGSQEEWKYSGASVSALSRMDFRPALVDLGSIEEEAAAPFFLEGLECYRLVFVNGRFYEALSDISGLPQGVTLYPLGEALQNQAAVVQSAITDETEFAHLPLVTINTAFMNDGVVLKIKEGVVVEKPIHIVNITQNLAPKETLAAHLRNIIVLSADSNVTVIESYAAIGEGKGTAAQSDSGISMIESGRAYWNNVATQIEVGRGAVLNHYKIQSDSPLAYHLATTGVTMQESSELNSFTLSTGGKVGRNDVRTCLNGGHIQAAFRGIYLGRGNQHLDNYLPVEHAKPNSSSIQEFNGVLDDNARGTFYGKIIVPQDAQKTDARQMNRNLLLSATAQADSRPELEIYADDVKCSHGSAIGQIDQDALYYLRARGITEQEARSMLVEGFISELLEHVPEVRVKATMREIIRGWLSEGIRTKG